jgi:hypothetical protein
MVRPALQPLVLCHGRLQSLQLLTNLRHFRKPQLVEHPAIFSTAGCSASPLLTIDGQRGQKSALWRAAASQQLVGYETAVAKAAADPATQPLAASARDIRPGEVHVWWLDLTQVC